MSKECYDSTQSAGLLDNNHKQTLLKLPFLCPTNHTQLFLVQ